MTDTDSPATNELKCEFHWAEDGCENEVEYRGAIKLTPTTVESIKFFCETGVDDLTDMLKGGTIAGFWVERWEE